VAEDCREHDTVIEMLERRRLGRQGLEVSVLGLGCLSMTGTYGAADQREAIATIHRARELGITLLDTAEAYGPFTNEMLVGRAIKGRRDGVIIATKFGALGWDSRPAHVKQVADASLRRLGVDCIDLFYQHRVDPKVPIEDTVGAMADLVQAGKVRFLGLSEASAETIRRAHRVHPITALQSEYSLLERSIEAEILPTVRALGIGFVAYSPLSRGFLTGKVKRAEQYGLDDYRRHLPRLQGENFDRNMPIVEAVGEMAAARGVTAGQLALAWLLHQGDDIVAIPGTKRVRFLEQNVRAADIALSEDDLRRLDDIAPVGAASGARGGEAYLRRIAS
jgi:aryl-alcohol dehydrogenase-like predicted oxidoreductase